MKGHQNDEAPLQNVSCAMNNERATSSRLLKREGLSKNTRPMSLARQVRLSINNDPGILNITSPASMSVLAATPLTPSCGRPGHVKHGHSMREVSAPLVASHSRNNAQQVSLGSTAASFAGSDICKLCASDALSYILTSPLHLA